MRVYKIEYNLEIGRISKREEWLDILRGLGIILMIIGHCGCPELLNKVIYGFHMPFFFVLSGYLFNEKKWKQGNSIKYYILHKWKAYMIPYFALCFCNLVMTLGIEFLAQVRGRDLLYSAGKHLFYILYAFGDASKMPNCSPLWFLPCLFIADIYLYLYVRINKMQKSVVFLIGMIVILFFEKKNVTQLPWHFDVAFIGMIFMYIGFVLKQKNVLEKINVVHKVIFFGVGGGLILLNARVDMVWRQFGNIVFFFCGAVGIVMLFMSVFYKFKKGKIISWIGRNSIFFMGFNILVNVCINIVEKRSAVVGEIIGEWFVKTIINVLTISLIIIFENKIKIMIKKAGAAPNYG